MPKNGSKKKEKASEEDLDVEIIFRTEIKFENTKDIIGVAPEFKWGGLYQMIRDHNISDACLEEMIIYKNIRKSGITKAATRLELFPCSEVIGWIFPRQIPPRGLSLTFKGNVLLHLLYIT